MGRSGLTAEDSSHTLPIRWRGCSAHKTQR